VIVSSIIPQINTLGIGSPLDRILAHGLILTLILLVGLLLGSISKQIIRRVVAPIIRKTKSQWDDVILDRGVLDKMTPLVTWTFITAAAPVGLALDQPWGEFVLRVLQSGLVGLVILALGVLLDGANGIYETYPVSRQRPIKGYIQLIRIFLYIIAAIVLITGIINISPVAILSGFGAMSAVILLVFRDTLLGLASGVQLSSNDMVRLGDWIEMPKYGADGDVIDINLQTVKVRNWDMTITTIPIYALISDSFKNWRGMSESGGRRIMRSLYIDGESVRFLTQEEIDRFSKSEILGSYIQNKLKDLQQRPGALDETDPSRRRLTNLGTFRAYVTGYIDTHPGINQSMIHMVRLLEPTPDGIPLQVYGFTRDIGWINYEKVQGDIFDHLLSVISQFGLHLYQHPSGYDLQKLLAKAHDRVT
jgi:miniconductance mechanosensitive channel